MGRKKTKLAFHAIRKGNFVNFLLTGDATGFRAIKENGDFIHVSMKGISDYEVNEKNFKLTTLLTYNEKPYAATVTGRVSEDIASGKIEFYENTGDFE